MNKQRSAGVVFQYLQMALSVIISLIYTPTLIRVLGPTEYGIYNLSASIISYLSLLSLGFGASYLRYYSIYKKDDNQEGIKKLNGLYLLVFAIIGIIALTAGLLLTQNVEVFFNETYSAQNIETASTLMLLLSVNLAISFPASVFLSYITAHEQFIFQKCVNMIRTVLSPLLVIAFLFLGYGSIGMLIATTIISILVDIANVIFCFTKLKMKISFKSPNYALLKDIFVFSIFIALNQIIDQINWQTDKVILGKICNGAAVAIYAVGAQINTMYTSFSTAVSSVFAPKINMIVSKHENDMDEQLTFLFIRVGRIQWFIMFLVLSGFVLFGQYFVLRWAGQDYSNAYWIALLLMAPATVPLIQNIGIEIQRAKNKHQFRSIVYAFMAIINVGISIWFTMLWGEIGAAVGTTISLILANGIIMNIYYQKKLGINIIEFWKSIGKTLPGLILPVIGGTCMVHFYQFKGLVDFALLVLAYVIIYGVSVYFLGLNSEEKAMVNRVFKKVLKR